MNGGFGRMDRMYPLYGRNDIPPHILRNRRNLAAVLPHNNLFARTNASLGAASPQRALNLRYGDAYMIAALQNGFLPSSGVSLAPASLGGTQLAGLRTPLGYDRLAHRELSDSLCPPDFWRPDHLPCSTNSSSCKSGNKSYPFDTKDIVIRGKARVVRKSYLHESPKFEMEVVKYLDKKSKEQVPEKVVDLMIQYINLDSYENTDVVDEVTLNILAFNVGARSVVDYSLGRLKAEVKELDLKTLGSVTATILMCTKVDSGLTGWLKKLLEKGGNAPARALANSVEFNENVLVDRPEVLREMERLLEIVPKPKDGGFRSL